MAGGTRSDTLPPLDSRHDILWRRAVSTQNHAQGAKHPLPNRYDTGLEMWPRGDKWRSGTLPSGRQRRPMLHFWTAWIDSGHLVPLVIGFLVDSTAQLRGGSKEPERRTHDGRCCQTFISSCSREGRSVVQEMGIRRRILEIARKRACYRHMSVYVWCSKTSSDRDRWWPRRNKLPIGPKNAMSAYAAGFAESKIGFSSTSLTDI